MAFFFQGGDSAARLAALDRSQAVIEFEPDGTIITANANFLNAMGYTLEDIRGKHHGIFVDDKHVWVGNSNAPSQLLKFTRDGKFILRIGKEEAKSGNDTVSMAGPTQMIEDSTTRELFVADGYRNRRVVVFDAETGAVRWTRQIGERNQPAIGIAANDARHHAARNNIMKADDMAGAFHEAPDLFRLNPAGNRPGRGEPGVEENASRQPDNT